ncbi:MAG: hypothetical protein ACI8QG_003010 [Flavobacteriales bacterium]|jgi:hypothetical protein
MMLTDNIVNSGSGGLISDLFIFILANHKKLIVTQSKVTMTNLLNYLYNEVYLLEGIVNETVSY